MTEVAGVTSANATASSIPGFPSITTAENSAAPPPPAPAPQNGTQLQEPTPLQSRLRERTNAPIIDISTEESEGPSKTASPVPDQPPVPFASLSTNGTTLAESGSVTPSTTPVRGRGRGGRPRGRGRGGRGRGRGASSTASSAPVTPAATTPVPVRYNEDGSIRPLTGPGSRGGKGGYKNRRTTILPALTTTGLMTRTSSARAANTSGDAAEVDILQPADQNFEKVDHETVVREQKERLRRLRSHKDEYTSADLLKRQIELKAQFNGLKGIVLQYNEHRATAEFTKMIHINPNEFEKTKIWEYIHRHLEEREMKKMANIDTAYNTVHYWDEVFFGREVVRYNKEFQVNIPSLLSLTLMY